MLKCGNIVERNEGLVKYKYFLNGLLVVFFFGNSFFFNVLGARDLLVNPMLLFTRQYSFFTQILVSVFF